MVRTGYEAKAAHIYKYSILAAGAIELGSLAFIGWNPLFVYGLALGTCIAVVNYNILVLSAKWSLSLRRGLSLAVVGYIVRLGIYGGVFLMSYKTGTASGIATLLGYMTVKLGMFYVYGFMPGFRSRNYQEAVLKDLDQDQWALERAEKAKNPGHFRRRFQRITDIFRSGNNWQDREPGAYNEKKEE